MGERFSYQSLAGAGAYVFAKRSVTADRKARHEEERQQRIRAQMSLDEPNPPPLRSSGSKRRSGSTAANSPSNEASADPAPTRHAPENLEQTVKEKSKYAPSEPYRSKKGDRFS